MKLKHPINSSSYNICPKCYNDSPKQIHLDIEDNFIPSKFVTKNLKCFQCPNLDCNLANRNFMQYSIRKCTICDHEMYIIKKLEQYILKCSSCTYCILFPKTCINIKLVKETCYQCNDNDPCKLLYLTFIKNNSSIQQQKDQPDDDIYCLSQTCSLSKSTMKYFLIKID